VANERHTFSLSLTTPDGAVFDDEAEMVIVPGAAGEIGVLARHAPLIALLKAGSTRVYRNRQAQEVEEFERVDRGESEADRWQLEQRIKAAENQLAAAGR